MNERGVALPTAMIAMAILMSLIVVLMTLATSEPQIANNQVASAQARALAESGLERAIWALTMGETNANAAGVASPSPSASPTPSPSPSPSPKPVKKSEPRKEEKPSKIKSIWNKAKGIFK